MLGGVEWAVALENFKNGMQDSPDAIAAQIISTFGGMGSLNDVVLYKSGQPLIAENTEFDELRSQLFRLCRE